MLRVKMPIHVPACAAKSVAALICAAIELRA